MADGTLLFDTKLNADAVKKGVEKLSSFAKTGLKATTAAITTVSTALAGAAGYAVKVGSSFEAGMSEVAAISGATGKDLENLTDKAKEMGSKTKFSATQSAEAFKYMAMAGWDSAQMCDGIAGVMNLAAASGEDLATTSDIVTDALTAFGLKASDATHFSDVLAKTSSSANTNVSLLGETFKYVAPAAGSLGYSVEDMSVAIGLMANAGIKGTQAGTSLRSTLTRMAKPTKESSAAMEKLGLSLTDSQGKMKPFNEIMIDMRKGFKNLSAEEKASTAAMLGGQEAMSGLLAIVNASDDDFNKLTDAVKNCDGASEAMANTMNDNLQGQITLLKSAVEGLGISVYEKLQEPLKNLAKQGSTYVGQLSDAMSKSGINGMVAELGNVFADVATKAAENAPKLIDTAVSMIDNFNKGLEKNSGKLAKAGVNLVKSLINGMTTLVSSFSDLAASAVSALLRTLLGSKVSKAFDDFAKSAKQSFSSIKDSVSKVFNSIKSAARTLLPVLLNLASGGLKVVAKAIQVLADNAKVLVPIVLSCITAVKLFGAAMAISTKITAMVGAVKSLSTATGVATGATKLFNAVLDANPIVLLASTIISVVGALGVFSATISGVTQDAEECSDKIDEVVQSSKDLTDKLKENRDARKEDMDAVQGQSGAIDVLTQRLFDLADKNGKSDKEMAEMHSLVEQLNKDVPNLNLAIDDQTGKLNLNKEAILGCVDAQKNEVLLTAAQEKMKEVAEERVEAQMKLKELEEDRKNKLVALNKATKDYNELLEKVNAGESNEYQRLYDLQDAMEQAQQAYDGTNSEIEQQNENIRNADKELNTYQDIIGETKLQIDDYTNSHIRVNDALIEVTSATGKAWSDIVTAYNNGVDASGKAIDKSKYDMENWATNMDALSKKGIDDGIIKNLSQMGDKAAPYLYALETMTDDQIKEINSAYQDSLKPQTGVANNLDAANNTANQKLSWMNEMASNKTTQLNGAFNSIQIKPAVDKAMNEGGWAVRSGMDYLKNTADSKASGLLLNTGNNMAAGLTQGFSAGFERFKQTLQTSLDAAVAIGNAKLQIHSPSRVFAKMGKYMVAGLDKGWSDNIDDVKKSISSSLQFDAGALSTKMQATVAYETSHPNVAIKSEYRENQWDNSNSGDNAPIVVESHINVDGREIAKATTPYISRQMANNKRGGR